MPFLLAGSGVGQAVGPLLLPAARLLDPVDAFRQAVGIHHQVVLGEGRRFQIVPPAHLDRVEAQGFRHLVEQRLEYKARVDRAVAAEGAAGRGVAEHPPADIADILQVVDRVEQRAGIEDRDDAVARMGAAALVVLQFDAGDLAVLGHADLEPQVGLRPAAMGDEGLLPGSSAAAPCRRSCGRAARR